MTSVNNAAGLRVNASLAYANRQTNKTAMGPGEILTSFTRYFSAHSLTRDELCSLYQEAEEFKAFDINKSTLQYSASPVRAF